MNKPRPRNAQEAKKWNTLNEGDVFFPIRDWPWVHQRNAMSSALPNLNRVNYWTFLVGNGIPPGKASFMVQRNSRSYVGEQTTGLEKMHLEGKLDKYKYYDMTAGKYHFFK